MGNDLIELNVALWVEHHRRCYRRRSGIEIMFGGLKGWRRPATRYDRCPAVFITAVYLAAAVVLRL